MNYAKYELRTGIAGIEIGSFEKLRKHYLRYVKDLAANILIY